ncbi:ribonuclease kappa-B-like [Wyeomyia smithii]|uniref:ribonuclease kappa-B-like n=1 Tax=Wyeomyia smithii TaxID=174621 RepID=UPI002467DE39|nr:ribonuclease kappa-B-like [Wyeomyia smithii]
MPVCGTKLSVLGMVISVWGILQLCLLGFMYQNRAVALVEDFPKSMLDKVYNSSGEFYAEADQKFDDYAFQCWIAAGLYVVTLLFSSYQYYANSQTVVDDIDQ